MTSVSSNLSDLEPGKTLQPLAVGTPVGSTSSGGRAIQVEVYALGVGVALAGQGCDLLGREGAFELEARGVRLVFHPLSAKHTEWFVVPVEGDIAPVVQPLEAVDQEDLAHGRFPAVHSAPPTKAVVLSLPPGFGKSRIAPALARRLGCTAIVDEWTPTNQLTPGALHITNDPLRDPLEKLELDRDRLRALLTEDSVVLNGGV